MKTAFRVYTSMFGIRFNYNLQYRAAVLGAIAKGFCWAMMEILGYLAVYRFGGDALPMDFSSTAAYVWAHQSFIVLFSVVFADTEIYSAIRTGTVVYDLARPIGLYGKWFCESASNRLSFALVNCFPVLILGLLAPAPFKLTLPASSPQLCLFLVSALLAFAVTVAIAMLMYISLFYFISQRGIRIIVRSVTTFFSGGVIPLVFFPESVQQVIRFLPFAAMQNMPLQILCGTITDADAVKGIGFQVFWLTALVFMGQSAMKTATKKVLSLGG